MGPLTAVAPVSAPEPRTSALEGWLSPFRSMLAWLDMAVEDHPALAFAVLTACYGGMLAVLSSVKLLWLDELITLHIARLGSLGAIWHALSLGADPNPPLTHLAVHYARLAFGEHEWALRLPAMLGYWLGMLSLFAYLRRRVPATWALAGTVTLMTMGSFEYSYESRSYGIFFGLAMAAFFCWSCAVNVQLTPTKRRVALVGMLLALALGLCTNYFAVLAFVPIAAGEVARTWRKEEQQRRKTFRGSALKLFGEELDWRVWGAMALAALPLLAFRHLMAAAIARFAPYAWNKVSLDQAFDSYIEMVEIVLYPILALLAFTGVIRLLAYFSPHCREDLEPRWLCAPVGALANEMRKSRATLPGYEAVGVLALMAYPFLGYAAASMHGGMLSPRLVIPVCFGFAMAATFAAYRLFRQYPLAAPLMLIIMFAWFVARESVMGYWYHQQKKCFYNVLAELPQAEQAVSPGSLLVVADPLMALTLQYYAPADVRERLVFPADFPALRHFRGDDSPDENLWAGRGQLYTLPVLSAAELQQKAGEYLILGSKENWFVEDLLRHRYPVEQLAIKTHTDDIGGFTPLNHGPVVFFAAAGNRWLLAHGAAPPVEFKEQENVPAARWRPAQDGLFRGRDLQTP